jgi:hypothetical protein
MVIPMNAYEILGTVVWFLFTLAMAVLCLFWPRAVRDFGLRTSPRFNPFIGFMKSPSYIWSIRITGLIALLMVLLASTGLILGRK